MVKERRMVKEIEKVILKVMEEEIEKEMVTVV